VEYGPKDADDLTYLCNHLLRTLCIDLAGYATDIVKRNLEPEPVLGRTIGISLRLAEKCLVRLERLDENPGTRAARTRLGPELWASLTEQSQLLLATAMDSRRLFKSAPCYDFSGVIVQVCKSVEIELGRALKNMLMPLAQEDLANFQVEPDDEHLVELVWKHKGTLTLGQFRYILKQAHQRKSPLWCAAYAAITQAEGSPLLSKPFYGKALNKLLHNFRNPAAHDKVFNSAQCEECLQQVLGGVQQPGILGTVLSHMLKNASRQS